MSTTYLVTFDRIGRNHNVEPLMATADDADYLAEQVYRYARPRMLSREVDVELDLESGKGSIFAGVNNGGTFTIAVVDEQGVTPVGGAR